MAGKYSVYGLSSIPEVSAETDLAEVISRAAIEERVGVKENDLVVVSSKVSAKAEGRTVDLQHVRPSSRAQALGKLTGKDPRRVEVIMRESKSVIGYISTRRLAKDLEFIRGYFGSMEAVKLLNRAEAVLLTEMFDSSLASDAGTDLSNTAGEDTLCLLPADPHETARELRSRLEERHNCRVAVILSDSEVRLMRFGTAEIALGWSGIRPLARNFGAADRYGQPKFGGGERNCGRGCQCRRAGHRSKR